MKKAEELLAKRERLEALVAAVFLDSGWERCQGLVRALFGGALDAVDIAAAKDPKTRLQEWLQARGLPLPSYAVEQVEGLARDGVVQRRHHPGTLPRAALAGVSPGGQSLAVRLAPDDQTARSLYQRIAAFAPAGAPQAQPAAQAQ